MAPAAASAPFYGLRHHIWPRFVMFYEATKKVQKETEAKKKARKAESGASALSMSIF